VESKREELLVALEAMHTGDIYATSEMDFDLLSARPGVRGPCFRTFDWLTEV
jgi:hypothetical protein